MRSGRHAKVVLAVLVLGAAVAAGMIPGGLTSESRPERTRSVVLVEPATHVDTERLVRFSGVVRAEKHAVLSFPVSARLVSRPVEAGDHVAAGAILAQLDARAFQNAMQSAEAAVAELAVRLEQAERDRNRVERLFSVKAATAEESEHVRAAVDAVQAAHSAASAQVAEARRVLGEAALRAPFAGTVTSVMLEPGEMVGPGMPIVHLSGDGRTELQVDLPESVIHAIAPGMQVTIELPFAGRRTVPGRIKSVARAATGPGLLFPVVIGIESPGGVAAGMTAEALISVRSDSQLSVPVRAVVNPGSSRPAVFVVREGAAKRVTVDLGSITGTRVAVVGALAAGEYVIVEGQTLLSDGDSVEVGR